MSAASTATATRLILPRPSVPFRSLLLSRRRGRLRRAFHASAVAAGGGGGGSGAGEGAAKEPPRTLFPGGFKRPEIQVPALVLRVGAEEALRCGDEVAAAVSRGVGIVVLEAGEEGGGRAYEAARALRATVGDRAYLLIAERVDVASAVGASGVVLADDGIPAIVARSMMMKSNADSIYLPIVARRIQSANSAISASSSEGADFLIVNTGTGDFTDLMNGGVGQHVKIPIFFTLNHLSEGTYSDFTSRLLQSGASGVVTSLAGMQLLTDDLIKKYFSKVDSAEEVPRASYSSAGMLEDVNNVMVLTRDREKTKVAGFTKLDEKVMQLIEIEKPILNEAIAIIRKAAPMMEEVELLVDAASRLSEPFLLVTVGEFNSGKSTFINALLGRQYLQEGVVPTTNEITLLSYSEVESESFERCERHPDGQFMCYLSVPILKEMNLVDTPGTNVILQRQQRLTEEYVPRADLILFVLSSDRPLTESEVGFLQYVQQWKKKVVFVLNKLDLYRNSNEIERAKGRAVTLMGSTLQLSNIDLIFTYTVKGKTGSSTRATSFVQNDILSPTLDDAVNLLGDYSTWLSSSNTREAKVYLECFSARWDALVGPEERALLDPNGLVNEGEKLTIKALDGFNASAAAKVFEEEIREVAFGTFGGLGIAGLSASLLTSVLSTTLEDLLALALCSAGGFFVLSSFPGRRKLAIQKVNKAADELSRKVDEAIQKDISQSANDLIRFVEVISKPYQEACQRKIDWLQGVQGELSAVERKLQTLKVEIQNLHGS
ncbi:hypothetical protein SORBI_3009G125400 [Sorghum bicolor]|uniref:G domain-containing protein n=1 Tax=Sorghum bicolor TaxID=4558 RepID=A0A1B6P839_SORBI|nr:hypothetical protein SORBI_3009G125400 [Sorghum bicolor]